MIQVLLLSLSLVHAADQRQVTVQGTCLKNTLPDRGSIEFFSESVNNDAQKAIATATKSYEAARESVKKMNLKNLELSTIENSLQEDRTWENNKSVFKGYRARLGLRVYTSQIERLSEVLQTVSKQGIKNFGSLQSDLSPQKLQQEQEACLEIAIQNAKSKADKMAKAAGAKVGRVIFLQEGATSSGPVPRPMMMAKTMSFAGSEDAAATVDTKAETLSMSVTVSYSLD